jgi:hypothetical protein
VLAAARAAGLRVAVKRDDRFSSRQEGGTWYLDEVRDLADVLGV